jgi:phage-related protein
VKRTVSFYRTAQGRCPVEIFLDELPGKIAKKITWVLKLIEDLEYVPATYLTKLRGTGGIWECRINFASHSYRILCFFRGESSVILTNGFMKKTKKTPRGEIDKADAYRKDFLKREAHHERS